MKIMKHLKTSGTSLNRKIIEELETPEIAQSINLLHIQFMTIHHMLEIDSDVQVF